MRYLPANFVLRQFRKPFLARPYGVRDCFHGPVTVLFHIFFSVATVIFAVDVVFFARHGAAAAGPAAEEAEANDVGVLGQVHGSSGS